MTFCLNQDTVETNSAIEAFYISIVGDLRCALEFSYGMAGGIDDF